MKTPTMKTPYCFVFALFLPLFAGADDMFPFVPSKATATKCWALDERGERKAEVPVEADADGLAAIRIDPKYKTVWYEISVN